MVLIINKNKTKLLQKTTCVNHINGWKMEEIDPEIPKYVSRIRLKKRPAGFLKPGRSDTL
ncbi:hypothetical protein DDT91_13745 [Algoriphagus sp. AK58]|nr:hypothetical protein [Algoriphagus sp. AK58]